MQETPIQEKQNVDVKAEARNKMKKEIFSWIRELAAAIVIVMIIKTFFFEIITVDGGSMLETLKDGDKLYVSILTPRLQGYDRGDIVICYFPGREDRCVKRIIAMPGDTVKVVSGTVYVNGEAIEEEYVTHIAGYHYPEIMLEEGEYFVLGDNRPISHDSHSHDVGPVSRIEGKVRFVLWPFDRFGAAK